MNTTLTPHKRTQHKTMLNMGIWMTAITLLLSSCATTVSQPVAPDLSAMKQALVSKAEVKPIIRNTKLSLKDRLATPQLKQPTPTASAQAVYSFQASNMNINAALRLFATSYKLNIVADKEVNGSVSVAFHNLAFDQSMQAILGSLGYYWERHGDLIRVRLIDDRIFTVNYLRLSRSDKASHQATVSTASSGGGGGAQGSSFSVEHVDKISFWAELEEQLKQMVSKEDYARIVVNKMSGTIQVVDNHARVESIANFIHTLNDAIKRQIAIEVQIVEVTLNEDYNLGIDWTAVDASLSGVVFNITSGNIVTTALAGVAASVNPLSATVGYNADNGNRFSSIINALQEQGDINIVSKPHVRTLNNQPALIKVGTDRTFFSTKTVSTSTAAGTLNNVNDTAQVITEGIVLSLTPQISADNWIMMDVSPVLTRVINEVTSRSGLSTAPDIDVRQSTSVVRVHSGDTIILGGLIQDLNAETNRKVPGLGDIPTLGKAFSGQRKVSQKKELVIFITPRVVDTDRIMQEVQQ